MTIVARLLSESWQVLGEMAPYLLLGFLVAGVLSVCISPAWVERHLGGRGLKPVFAASLLGVPLPLCSCGVIPVSASMRRHGASRAATTAFLLSTPQTGVDSIAATWALLGPVFAIFRPVAALLTGILGGFLIRFFAETNGTDEAGKPHTGRCTEACCEDRSQHGSLVRMLRYGFVTLPRDIGPALLVGILIAGAIATLFVRKGQLHTYAGGEILSVGGGILAILLLMAIGVPFYVCATASVPIAAGFIHMGVSPGAAFAFLVAGPATNAATLATVWKVMGRRTAILYLATVALSAIAGGLLLNWLSQIIAMAIPPLADGDSHGTTHAAHWSAHLAAVALLAVLAVSYCFKAKHRKESQEDAEYGERTGESSRFQRLELSITGMRCSHCAESVRRSLGECDGVRSADVDLRRGRAVVVGEHLDPGQLTAAVAGLGYGAAVSDETPPATPWGS